MSETVEKIKIVENHEIHLFPIFKKIWEGRNKIFKWMGFFFVLGIIIIIFSPKEYKSEVTVLVETGSGTNGMSSLLQQFGGLAGISMGTTGEDALTPEIYPGIIKSTPFILEVMNKTVTETKYDSTLKVSDYILRHTRPGIGSIVFKYTVGLPGTIIGWIKGKEKIEEKIIKSPKSKPLKLSSDQALVIKQLIKRINTRQVKSFATLTISVEMQDPVVAAQVSDSVVLNLTRYIIAYRTQKAKNDLKFIEERHSEAEKRYKAAQLKLAGYRDRNKNVILASTLTSEQDLQAEYNLALNVYNTLSQQLEQAKIKVQEKTPVFKVMDPPQVPLEKIKPRKILVLFGMLFLGGIFGFLLILLPDIKLYFDYFKT